MNHHLFPPVFPQDVTHPETEQPSTQRIGGMTLLDYAAIQALPSILQAHIAKGEDKLDPFNIACVCYQIAGGFIAARNLPEEVLFPKPPEIVPPPEEPTIITP